MVGFVMGSGGGTGTDVSDTTALATDVLPGKEFYLADGTKTPGAMPTKAAATIIPSSSVDSVITANQYLTGAQTVPKDANFIPANIKNGVKIWGQTGTYNKQLVFVISSNVYPDANGRLVFPESFNFIPMGVFFQIDEVNIAPSTYKCVSGHEIRNAALVVGDLINGVRVDSSGNLDAWPSAIVYSVSQGAITLAPEGSGYSFYSKPYEMTVIGIV